MDDTMLAHLKGFPDQILEGFDLGLRLKLPAQYRKLRDIVFCGMGGSAIGGDIIAELMVRQSRVPFYVNREYTLPSWAGRDTLVILSSYSGNTEETMGSFRDALRRKCRILVITSGGQFFKLAVRKNLPCIVIPPGLPPRCAIGLLSLPLIAALTKGGWLKVTSREVRSTADAVSGISRGRARAIAAKLLNRHVFLYGPSSLLGPVLRRWRGQLAENAKAIASHHALPEMLHNEIEGWRFPEGFARRATAVFLTDDKGCAQLRHKISLAQKIMQKQKAKTITLKAPAGGLLEQIFGLIALGDWVSYELAILYGVDPVAIPAISAIKKA